MTCGPARSPDVALVLHRTEDAAALEQALSGLDAARFERKEVDDPSAVNSTGLVLAVLKNEALCGECYSVKRDGSRVTVAAGGALGLQYGLTHSGPRSISSSAIRPRCPPGRRTARRSSTTRTPAA